MITQFPLVQGNPHFKYISLTSACALVASMSFGAIIHEVKMSLSDTIVGEGGCISTTTDSIETGSAIIISYDIISS